MTAVTAEMEQEAAGYNEAGSAVGRGCWFCDDGNCGLSSATVIDVFGSCRPDGSRAGDASSSS
jgi:hypothetical protein